MYTFILIELDLLHSIGIVTEIGVTCIHHLNANILHNQASHSYHNTSNTPNIYPLNTSELIGSLQNQIIGLQSQPLQQSKLYSIKKFDGTNKAEFATWAQSIENAVRLCNLDALSISLSKLQGTALKSAYYLEGKETKSDKNFPGLH